MTLAQRLVSISAISIVACGGKPTDGAASGSASAPLAASAKVLAAADDASHVDTSSTAKAAVDPIVAIPKGAFLSGSTPGDRGRDPSLEPAQVSVELAAYDIDRYFYPNDGAKPPLLGVSRSKAAELCQARGRRLCTELEWERACKGAEEQPYAGRNGWDPACTKAPQSCASGFGVLGMGALREWTASDVPAIDDIKKGASVRGSPPNGSDLDRRCAHRQSVSPESDAGDIGFRCCGGEANSATVAKPESKPTFEKTTLAASELSEMFSVVPQLAKLGGTIAFFDQEATVKTVMSRADAGTSEPKGWDLTVEPLAWRPITGEDLVVVTGLAGEDSFIVALYKMPDGRFRVASSLVLKRDKGPVVLAYDRSVQNRLEWSTCWQCPGESGRISYRDDRRVIITQE